jgi:hypothetical protein
MGLRDNRIKPMGNSQFYDLNTDPNDVLFNEASKWVEDFQSNNNKAQFPWNSQIAEEFRTVPIQTLIKDPYFLGFEDNVYDGVLNDIVDLFEAKKVHPIHLAIFLEGIGAGKTVKASILMWMIWYYLSMDPDPQSVHTLAPRSVIALLMMSRSELQAKRITFGEVWNRFQSPFNKDYFPPAERFNREIRIEVNNTCVYAGTSSALSSLGYNLFGGVIDEACLIKSTLQRVKFENQIDLSNINLHQKNLHSGAIVSSYNITNKKVENQFSKGISSIGFREIYEVELEDGTILGLTGNQKVLIKTSDGKEVYKRVDQLTGNEDLREMKIKSIRKKEVLEPVYDVVNVKNNKNFLVKTDSGKYIVLHNSFLESTEESKKSEDKYDACEEIYHAIFNRMISRFLKKGRIPGLLCMVTSPNFPDDFVHKKIDEAKAKGVDSGIFYRIRSTWDAKGERYYPVKDAFYINTDDSEIINDDNLTQLLNAIPKKMYPLDYDMELLTKLAKYFIK